MGEVAEDMMGGAACSGCGIYFEKEHGFPVLCRDCWKVTAPRQRDGLQRATEKEL